MSGSILHQLHGDEVLDVQNADGACEFVDDGHFVGAVFADECDGVLDEGVTAEGSGVAGHDLLDGLLEQGGVGEDESAEVGVGEDAGEAAVGGIGEEHGSGPASFPGGQAERFGDDHGVGEGVKVAADNEAKNVDDGTEEAAERAARVATGEIGIGESAASGGREGERIAEGDGGGCGVCGGDEVGSAGLSIDAEPQGDAREIFERGPGLGLEGRADDGDDGDSILSQDGGEGDDFGGVAGVGDAHDGVGGAEAAEVAVGGFGGVDAVGGDAEGGEGGGELLADEAGLAEAGDQDGSAGGGAPVEEFDGAVEGAALGGGDGFGEILQRSRLGVQNFRRVGVGEGVLMSGHRVTLAALS